MDPARIHPGHVRTVAAADVASSPPSSSEIGRVAQDIDTVIAQWQGRLHSALTSWLDDAERLNEILSNLKNLGNVSWKSDVETYRMLVTLQGFVQNDVDMGGGSITVNLTPSSVDQIGVLMNDLGISPGQLDFNPASISENSSGYYVLSYDQWEDLFNTIQSSVSGEKARLGSAKNEVAELKHDQTQDMFKVMVCFNSIKMNENTESSIMKDLKNMTDQMMQAIQ